MKQSFLYSLLFICCAHFAIAQETPSQHKVVIVKKEIVKGVEKEVKTELIGSEAKIFLEKNNDSHNQVLSAPLQYLGGTDGIIVHITQRAKSGDQDVFTFKNSGILKNLNPSDIASVDIVRNEEDRLIKVVLKNGVLLNTHEIESIDDELTLELTSISADNIEIEIDGEDENVEIEVISEGEENATVYIIKSIDKSGPCSGSSSDKCMRTASSCCKTMPIEDDKAYLGVMLISEEDKVIIDGIKAGSPAEKSGLLVGDVIEKIGKFKVDNFTSLAEAMSSFEPGETTTIRISRDGKSLKEKIVLDTYPVEKLSGCCGGSCCKFKFEGLKKKSELLKKLIIVNSEGDESTTEIRSISQLELPSLEVFPNPAESFVVVRFIVEPTEELIIGLYDVDGKSIMEESYDSFKGSFEKRYELDELVEGTVFLRLLMDGKSLTKPIVVQRR